MALRGETSDARDRTLHPSRALVCATCDTCDSYPWDTTVDYTFPRLREGGLVAGIRVRGIIHIHKPVVLLGARYGVFIPKGYVGIVLALNGELYDGRIF